MKKFWLGILSCILLVGGGIFTACGKPNVSLEIIGDSYKEICLNDESSQSTTVSVVVNGISGGTVTATSSNTNMVIVEDYTYNRANGRNLVTIKAAGKEEGTANVVITADYDHNISVTVPVTVYSNATAIEWKSDASDLRKRFLVKGQDNTLKINELLNIYPNQNSRTNIEWVLGDNVNAEGIKINGNVITVPGDYDGSKITLKAKGDRGLETEEVTFGVLDPIDSKNLKLQYGYGITSIEGGVSKATEVNLVPNIEDKNKAYIFVPKNKNNALDIKPVIDGQVIDANSPSNELSILQISSSGPSGEDYNIFEVKGLKKVNDTYKVRFQLGYKDYDYVASSVEFNVICGLMVDEIEVRNENGALASVANNEIYTSYKNNLGAEYTVKFGPNNVENASGKYKIIVNYTSSSAKPENNILSFQYRKGNKPVEVSLTKSEDGIFTTTSEDLLPSGQTIYIKADSALQQFIKGIDVTFISYDNEDVRETFKVDVYRSTTSMDIEMEQGETGDVKLASHQTPTSVTKTFTLKGQSTINGLEVVAVDKNGNEVEPEGYSIGEIIPVSFAAGDNGQLPTVKFSVEFKLLDSAIGETIDGFYTIRHKNGLTFEKFYAVSIFLPLTDARVGVDTVLNNSVTNTPDSTNKIYLDSNGELIEKGDATSSVSDLLVRNGGFVALDFITNEKFGKHAEAKLSFAYYDIDDANLDVIDLRTIYKNSEDASGIISATTDGFTARKVGKTYLIVKFTGLGADGEKVTYVRFILVEVYEAPTSFTISTPRVEVYARGSVDDSSQTSQVVTITLGRTPISDFKLEDFTFYSNRLGPSVIGKVSNHVVVWTNNDGGEVNLPYYSITDVKPNANNTAISFIITGIDTYGEAFITDNYLTIAYHNTDKVDNIYLSEILSVKVISAKRIEKLVWEHGANEDLYFEIGSETKNQIIVLTSSPADAKNTHIDYIATDDKGALQEKEPFAATEVEGGAQVTLAATSGMNGYLYLFPKDAVNNGKIYYYYDENKQQKTDSFNRNDLALYYDILVDKGYFYSAGNKVEFKDVLVKIKVVVADGAKEEQAYRIYTDEQFREIATRGTNNFYRVMNNITLNNWTSFAEIGATGGIIGNDLSVTITLTGQTLVNENKGKIKDLTIAGNVTGKGFVANTNSGTIENVTVDVYVNNGTYSSSTLTATGVAGGIVGQNSGTLKNVAVLGATINGSSDVGGIVGQMDSGSIDGARFEIYNFEDEANTLTGTYVGGVVGMIQVNSTNPVSIKNIYAYDYAMTEGKSHITGSSNAGALIGFVGKNSDTGNLVITNSFAVVNKPTVVGAHNENVILKNGYLTFYNSGAIESVRFNHEGTQTDSEEAFDNSWVSKGDDFDESINFKKPYLKDFHQELPLSDVSGYMLGGDKGEVVNNRGLYHAVRAEGEENGVLFFYQVSDLDKYVMQQNDPQAARELDGLNIINLKDLLGIDDKAAAKLVITAVSKNNAVSVNGNNVIINRTGSATFTLSSKYDYTNTKTIEVQVVNALSKLIATRSVASGSVNIAGGATAQLQRGKSMSVTYSFENAAIVLGTRGGRYTLLTNDYTLSHTGVKTDTDTNAIAHSEIARNIHSFKSSADTSENNSITATVEITGLVGEYKNAISEKFTLKYNINVFNGALTVGASHENVSITPMTSVTINATLVTTDKDDTITPVVELKNGDSYDELKVEGGYVYLNNEPVLEYVKNGGEAGSLVGGKYTKEYSITFSVAEAHKALVSKMEEYRIKLVSDSEVSSNAINLTVNKQDFKDVDFENFKIENSYVANTTIEGKYRTVYVADQTSKISVLAPGSSSILKVHVSPKYAYYDSFTLTYLDNTTVATAVAIDFMQYDEEKGYFYSDSKATVSREPNGIRVRNNNHSEDLYFKIFINKDITSDPNNPTDLLIKFNLSFFDSSQTDAVKKASFPLLVSYFTQPRILVNGSSTAMLANGEEAEIQVIVPSEYDVDINTVTKTGALRGITIGNDAGEPTWFEEVNPNNGLKTYTSKLRATVLAQAAGGKFELSITTRRVLNGTAESKTATAVVSLVKFNPDIKNVKVRDGEDDIFTAYLDVNRPLQFDTPIRPESYTYDANDAESLNAVKEIKDAIEDFRSKDSYIDNDNKFYINYNYNDREPDDKKYTARSLYSRLSYYSTVDDNWRSLPAIETGKGTSSFTYGGYLKITVDNEGKSILISGTKLTSEPLRFKLSSNVYAGGEVFESDYYFSVQVAAYSTEEAPLIVQDQARFEAMKEPNLRKQDYILMNDIDLENYDPISTQYIDSFDGNGYTINIKSFKDYSNSSSVTLALFNKVFEHTTIKNVRVNIYHAGQITINTSKFPTMSIRVAGFAISNEGVITNCEVVAFKPNENDITVAKPGINVRFVNSNGASGETSIIGTSIQSEIAGFVLDNSGSVTNSRVGGDSIKIYGQVEKDEEGNPTGRVKASDLSLPTFNIHGQGNIAGFALANGKNIASSFVKNVGISNVSSDSAYYAAGFVGSNNGTIVASYVEGAKELNPKDAYCRLGSSIISKMGTSVGFVYENKQGKTIKDCYSNILIANDEIGQSSQLASGFVYINDGALTNCLSLSQVAALKYSQMNFSGLNERGDLTSTIGTYTNCYYYSIDDMSDSLPTEEQYSTGAIQLKELDDVNYFYGFSFASGDSGLDGVWRYDLGNKIITLVEPNYETYANRYYKSDANDEEKYTVLPSIIEYGNRKPIEARYGSKDNPILIRTALEFTDVTGNSQFNSIKDGNFTDDEIKGTYRVVNDLEFSELTSDTTLTAQLPSSKKAFSGILFGNGFTFKDISISLPDEEINKDLAAAYGVFASIENGIVLNLNLTVKQVVNNEACFVGALAGFVKGNSENGGRRASLANINVSFNDNASVVGLNMVGGLVGGVLGDVKIKNDEVTNPNVVAARYVVGDATKLISEAQVGKLRESLYSRLKSSIITASDKNFIRGQLEDHSFAGGVIGYADIFTSEEVDIHYFSYVSEMKVSNYDITKLRVSGTATVRGHVAGGVVGLTGFQTDVKDAGLILLGTTTSHITATRLYAGGVIGQSFGALTQLFSQYDATTQKDIENNIGNYYSGSADKRGNTDIFVSTDLNDKQEAIGGLVGFVGSGHISISYSKLNVVSLSAGYAGGLIGHINASGAVPYSAGESAVSYLRLHEVYATGDVRAKTAVGAAGGIVGRMESRTAFEAVNQANFFSFTDYEKGGRLENVTKDTFTNLKVYSVVGSLDDVDLAVFTQIKEKSSDETTTRAADNEAWQSTVGTVKKYKSTEENILMFPAESGTVKKQGIHQTFDMPDITEFKQASEYSELTHAAFLARDFWLADDWYHPSEYLYPSIRFSIAANSYIYLDAYSSSIEKVFRAVKKNPKIEIRVRGKIDEVIDGYSDINLAKYLAQEGHDPIEKFAGKIVGVLEDNKVNGERYPRVILDRPLISQANSVNISNVTFLFEKQGSGSKADLFGQANNAGALINESYSQGRVSEVTFEIADGIQLQGSGGKGANVGLLAPTIESVSISGLHIKYTGDAPNAILTAQNATNVGLVSGTAAQRRSDGTMVLYGIDVTRTEAADDGAFIKVTSTDKEAQYVGGYFGLLQRDDDATAEIRLQLDEFKNGTSQSDPTKAFKAKYSIDGSESSNTYIGGYVGNVKALDSIAVSSEAHADFDFAISSTINGKLYAGGFFGQLGGNAGGAQNLSGAKGNVFSTNVRVQNPVKGDACLGGIAGENSVEFSLNNIQAELSTSGWETKSDGKNKLAEAGKKGNGALSREDAGYTFYPLTATTVYAGSYFGDTTANTTISTSGENNNIISTGDIVVAASGDINVGGLVGRASNSLTINGDIKYKGIISVGDYTSTTTTKTKAKTAKDDTKVINAGGFVGNYEIADYNKDGSTSNQPETINGKLEIRMSNVAESGFGGQIYTQSTKDFNGAGIVGNISIGDNSNQTITISNTSFSGAIKVLSSPKATIGGTIGRTSSNSTITPEVTKNYNYGDVFVYNQLANGSCYGGLIGQGVANEVGSSTNSNNKSIATNYILTTLHDEKPLVANIDNMNAVIGVNRTGIPTTNYYNHSVCLLTDDCATDTGFATAYNTSDRFGYGDYYINTTMQSKFKGVNLVNINENDNGDGTKLNPSKITTSGLTTFEDKVEHSTNGITYYIPKTDNGTFTLDQNKSFGNLNNVAIIGDANTLSYTNKNEDKNDNHEINLISNMTNFSSVSGLTVDANILEEHVRSTSSYVGGLAKQMTNGQIFAVGVTGKIEVGGTVQAKIGGLVGYAAGGYINNCYTDVTIETRSGNLDTETQEDRRPGGMAAAITIGVKEVLIANSYAVGSVKSYLHTQLDAFAINATVRNCYTATTLDANDYQNAVPQVANSVFWSCDSDQKVNDATFSGFYDRYAVIPKDTSNNSGVDKTTDQIIKLQDSTDIHNWEANPIFNSGYPVHKGFYYLRQTSYMKRDKIDEARSTYCHDSDGNPTNYTSGDKQDKPSEEIVYYDYNKVPVSELAAELDLTSGRFILADGIDAYYYRIPNAGVYARLGDKKFDGYQVSNFLLTNDLELDYLGTNEKTCEQFSGDLDGDGHRIYHANTTLFHSVSGGLRNFDVLDAKIENGSAIVANTVGGDTNFSNITLGGTLGKTSLVNGYVGNGTGNDNADNKFEYNVGALLGSSDNKDGHIVNLFSITNNTAITVTNSSASGVGGIVGSVTNGSMNYCVNNAPIVLENITFGGRTTITAVGGLIGHIGGNTNPFEIKYSYNTNAILAGYADTTKRSNRVGGILGANGANESEFNISYCYNAGMIKAGNKNVTSQSYAGGIVGQLNKGGSISNSINEGAVEAAAQNGTFEQKLSYDYYFDDYDYSENINSPKVIKGLGTTGWGAITQKTGLYYKNNSIYNGVNEDAKEKRNFDTSGYKFFIEQTSKKNVYASGICGYVQEGQVYNNYNYNYDIINNGSAFLNGKVVYEGKINLSEYNKGMSTGNWHADSAPWGAPHHSYTKHMLQSQYLLMMNLMENSALRETIDETYFSPQYSYLEINYKDLKHVNGSYPSHKKYNTDEYNSGLDKMYATAWDNYGCPVGGYLQTAIALLNSDIGSHDRVPNGNGGYDDGTLYANMWRDLWGGWEYVYDFYENWNCGTTDSYYQDLAKSTYGKTTNSNEELLKKIIGSTNANSKQDESKNYIKIAGEAYYLTNGSAESILENFEKGTSYQAEIEFDCPAYDPNEWNLQDFTITCEDAEVRIQGFSAQGATLKFELRIIPENKQFDPNKAAIKVDYSHTKEHEIILRDENFGLHYDKYSDGKILIYLHNIEHKINAIPQDNYITAITTDNDGKEIEIPVIEFTLTQKGNSRTVYLGYSKDKNCLMYIPKLQSERGILNVFENDYKLDIKDFDDATISTKYKYEGTHSFTTTIASAPLTNPNAPANSATFSGNNASGSGYIEVGTATTGYGNKSAIDKNGLSYEIDLKDVTGSALIVVYGDHDEIEAVLGSYENGKFDFADYGLPDNWRYEPYGFLDENLQWVPCVQEWTYAASKHVHMTLFGYSKEKTLIMSGALSEDGTGAEFAKELINKYYNRIAIIKQTSSCSIPEFTLDRKLSFETEISKITAERVITADTKNPNIQAEISGASWATSVVIRPKLNDSNVGLAKIGDKYVAYTRDGKSYARQTFILTVNIGDKVNVNVVSKNAYDDSKYDILENINGVIYSRKGNEELNLDLNISDTISCASSFGSKIIVLKDTPDYDNEDHLELSKDSKTDGIIINAAIVGENIKFTINIDGSYYKEWLDGNIEKSFDVKIEDSNTVWYYKDILLATMDASGNKTIHTHSVVSVDGQTITFNDGDFIAGEIVIEKEERNDEIIYYLKNYTGKELEVSVSDIEASYEKEIDVSLPNTEEDDVMQWYEPSKNPVKPNIEGPEIYGIEKPKYIQEGNDTYILSETWKGTPELTIHIEDNTSVTTTGVILNRNINLGILTGSNTIVASNNVYGNGYTLSYVSRNNTVNIFNSLFRKINGDFSDIKVVGVLDASRYRAIKHTRPITGGFQYVDFLGNVIIKKPQFDIWYEYKNYNYSILAENASGTLYKVNTFGSINGVTAGNKASGVMVTLSSGTVQNITNYASIYEKDRSANSSDINVFDIYVAAEKENNKLVANASALKNEAVLMAGNGERAKWRGAAGISGGGITLQSNDKSGYAFVGVGGSGGAGKDGANAENIVTPDELQNVWDKYNGSGWINMEARVENVQKKLNERKWTNKLPKPNENVVPMKGSNGQVNNENSGTFRALSSQNGAKGNNGFALITIGAFVKDRWSGFQDADIRLTFSNGKLVWECHEEAWINFLKTMQATVAACNAYMKR